MPKIYSEDLFKNILINPIKEGYNKLKMVSGYASSLMAIRHVGYLKEEDLLFEDLNISLIVGMTSRDGIDTFNHKGFIDICNDVGDARFNCRYVNSLPPVHSKVYIWYRDNNPELAFLGSANYSQTAFSNASREVLSDTNHKEADSYYSQILDHTIDCRDLDEENDHIKVFKRENISKVINPEADENIFTESIVGLHNVTLALTDSKGNVPTRSGLNWGQREGREPNQAYINIPAKIRRTNFFPERGQQFLVITDDGKEFICVRAQDGGKGLHTTFNNSLLGEYFRYRMGLANGEFVETSDLLEYGRKDVDFYKIDDETFLMDFSVTD